MDKFTDFTAKLLVRSMNSVRKFKEGFTNDERGALTFVEIALMILVVIALAFIFKDKLLKLVNDVFGKVDIDSLSDHSNTTNN